jgi:hypothetical protein
MIKVQDLSEDKLYEAYRMAYNIDFPYDTYFRNYPDLWAKLGQLIETFEIDIKKRSLQPRFNDDDKYGSWLSGITVKNEIGISTYYTAYGHSPKEAIIRCYVKSRLGEEISI